jgi:hypothetical protein
MVVLAGAFSGDSAAPARPTAQGRQQRTAASARVVGKIGRDLCPRVAVFTISNLQKAGTY